MINTTDHTGKLVDHLFRHQAGKMVAILTHFLGLNNLQLAEDVVQDAFMKALQAWKINGPPDTPEAWLLQTAKYQAIDLLRRKELHNRFTKQQVAEPEEAAEQFFHSQEITDSQLRLIFACCHPSLKQEDQVALTLKIVSAFSMPEIARALVANEAVVQKRISRAKTFLRDHHITLDIPAGHDLQLRLDTVYTVLYLLFNEGYNSLKSDELIRHELCAEAMRCCKLLTEHEQIKHPVANALLALMCLHAARFGSRMDINQNIILLREQDRGLWDKELIQVGLSYLNASSGAVQITSYHIEAAIAAEHCLACSFENTNWKRLLLFYDLLIKAKPGPVAELNRAIVLAEMGETETAISAILSIQQIDELIRTNHQYSAVLGDLYRRLSNTLKAREFLAKAWQLTPSAAEKKLLQSRLDEISRN